VNETVAIVNPKSANGRTARTFESLSPILPSGIDILHTTSRGHASELTSAALARGARTIVAVGGDGTIHEVVNGFFDGERMIAPDARLAIIPCGTGSDFRRATGIPADPHAAVELLRSGVARSIDVLRVTYSAMDGANGTTHAINVVSFGLGGAAAARSNSMSKAFGGRVSYALAVALTAARFTGNDVELRIDDEAPVRSRITQFAAGNGQFHGGGMRICPEAALDDGWIDVTIVGNVTFGELVRGLPSLYNGQILSHPKVSKYRAMKVEAFSDETVLIEADGEAVGKLPLKISILPGAINLVG
jgi:YegS/Rv2252/BmrU family lipid kinase